MVFRDVMVANAHQNPDPEAMKTFDRGYLVAVVGFLVCIDGSIILDYYIQFEKLRGTYIIEACASG